MNKQTITKIISGLIMFVFIVSIFQFALPTYAATNMSDLYSNPNQGGSNPYKFKISDVVNSNLLTNVVGCTGIVNKVSTWMIKFIQSPKKTALAAADKIKKTREQLRTACAGIKTGAEAGVGSIPFVNDLVTALKTGLEELKIGGEDACKAAVDATSKETIQELNKANEQAAETSTKEQCLDGIAITLAKNQLTAMTRSAMNWVNSGYGGNPFFVQNMRNFTNSIERNVIETGTDILLDKAFGNPYAREFAETKITSSRSNLGVGASSSGFLGGLQSDLGAFISDPKSFYSNDQLNQVDNTQTALQRAQQANNNFQNDFSVGGWDGYMALTQRDQNNPLGFSMLANQYLTNTQVQQVTEQKSQLAENNGFLSQKECILWQWYDKEGDPLKETPSISAKSAAAGLKTMTTSVFKPTKSTTTPNFDKCVDWKITTPGSIIRDKTTNYLNSPERQLELAKTINDSLNALFSILISKLEGGGLSGLSDKVENTSNWTDNINSFTSLDGNTPYDNNGAYDGFNLTRDLGNTYIHENTYKAGTWNANSSINRTDKFDQIMSGYLPPVYDDNKNQISTNIYWEVTTPGNTKIVDNGYNGWQVGDRAFWNGYEWQNWKKGQPSPIKNRGVIQIQQDYVVAATEILKVLPTVMPKLGELDYCLPGPNPSYKSNSAEAQSAYQNWVGSIFVGAIDSSNKRFGVKIDGPGQWTYDNLQNIYKDNQKVWATLLTGWKSQWNLIWTFTRFWDASGGSYTYDNNSKLSSDEDDRIQLRTRYKDSFTDYVNNFLFQGFYDSFDKMINRLYFNNVTKEYVEVESEPANTYKNPSYMPMAAGGYDLTKDIIFYDNEIYKSKQEYSDSVAQAKINISKLESIRTEVSKIIVAAQNRRDANLLLQINKINSTATSTCEDAKTECMENERGTVACDREYYACINELVTTGKILSKEDYLKEYKECFAEENIQVYDASSISNISVDFERCFNGIDDDLNGLADKNDPTCPGYVNPGTSGTRTSVSGGSGYRR